MPQNTTSKPEDKPLKPKGRSALKALRASKRKRAYNLRTKRKYKEVIKRIRKAIISKNKDLALEALPEAYRQLDYAAKKKVIHKNKASRIKSRLAAHINKLG